MVGWFFGMIAAFAVMYFSLPKKQLDDTGPNPVDPGLGAANSSLCEKKLVKWIQSVNPERLQFDTDVESRVQELNRYWETCGPQGDKPLVSDIQPIEAAITDEYRDRALSKRFGRRDIEHLRQSLLLGQMGTRIGESQKSDIDRALAALGVISDQLEPLPAAQDADRPLTPFECLMIGQGTPSDRAWIMVEILRQLRLDAVVLTTEEASLSPLVAVVIDKEVWLFDPLTGFPIPAAGERERKTIYRSPATLQAALADDSLFRQLDIEGTPFPWTAERLKSASVGLVGTSCTWAPRLAELQFQWPTNHLCVIYDGLGPSAGTQRGLAQRVSEVFTSLGFAGDRVRVWDYPERQCALYDSLGAEAAPHMVPLVQVMSGPRSFKEVPDAKTGVLTVVAQRSKRSLQYARVQHLLGHRTEAIGGYLPMIRAHRSAPRSGVPIDGAMRLVMDQNRIVADKATYWMASTQFENNDLAACLGTLNLYAKDFPLGVMREAAAMRQAACLEKTEKYEESAQILTGFGPGPNQLRRTLLARRLRELKGVPEAEPAAPVEATP